MNYADEMEKHLATLLEQPLTPYLDGVEKFADREGVYVIWASSKLTASLRGKELKIHAAKKMGNEVTLSISLALKQSIEKDGCKCLYIGKTTDFKARHAIRRHKKLREIISPELSGHFKSEMCYSFVAIKDWKIRFFSRMPCNCSPIPRAQ